MDKTETEKIINALAAVNEAVRYLNEALGHSDSVQAAAEYQRSLLTFVSVQKDKSKSTNTLTLEELNEMLVTLNIKLKAKHRKDGLFEITPTLGGKKVSIYGHSAEELAAKYKKKIREAKKRLYTNLRRQRHHNRKKVTV